MGIGVDLKNSLLGGVVHIGRILRIVLSFSLGHQFPELSIVILLSIVFILLCEGRGGIEYG